MMQLALPINGKSPRSRHASHSGAVYAARTRGRLSLQYLELLRKAGPVSDQTAARSLGREVSSINSTRAGLGDLIVDSGQYEVSAYGTKRVKWMVAK